MSKSLVALLLMAAACLGRACAADDADLARIVDEGFNHGQVVEIAAYLTDRIGGRMTNSPQMRTAERWTQEQLRSWGLKDVRAEGFDFGRGWSITKSSVRMMTPRVMPMRAIPVAWTPATPGTLSAAIVLAPVSHERDLAAWKGKLRGRVVLVSQPTSAPDPIDPPFRRLSESALAQLDTFEFPRTQSAEEIEEALDEARFEAQLDAFLAEEGALAWVRMSPRDGGLVHGEGTGFRTNDKRRLPGIELAAEDYRLLARLAKTGAAPTLEILSDVQFHDDDLRAYNVLADIAGRDASAGYVMAGAHLDSWVASSGAQDNAAGSAIVLEAARILAKLKVQPRRGIRFALWAGEEQGALGSFDYIERYLATRGPLKDARLNALPAYDSWPLRWPLQIKPGYEALRAYFNIDNGSGKLRGIYTEGNVAAMPLLREWLAPFASMGATHVVASRTGITDHLYMQSIGLPAFMFIQDPLDYNNRIHHTSLDSFDHMQLDDLRQAAVVLASVLLQAANSERQLPRTPVPSEPRAAPDALYLNGKVWTGESDTTFAEGLAISDGMIVAVGSSRQLRELAGERTRIVDLGGKLVTPGFIDASLGLLDADLSDATTPEEFVRRIAERARERPGEWVMRGNWDHQHWGGELPTRAWIDRDTGGTPVFVERIDGHMALANSAALRLARVDANTPDPPGGEIVRDARGEPTGILKDTAKELVSRVIPPPSSELVDAALARGFELALSNGVTQIHDMGGGGVEPIEAFRRSKRNGRLPLRVYSFAPLAEWSRLAARIRSEGVGDDWLRWGGVKGFVDGSLGSGTAWFNEPYDDAPGSVGLTTEEPAVLAQRILDADRAGLQVAVHAIGDRANDWLLDCFASVAKRNGARDRRFRIEHAQHLTPAAIPRFRALGVTASMQPYHAIDDGRWAERRIGKVRLRGTYAFRSLLDAGARLQFGSDWSVAPLDPIGGIDAAVNRRTLDGKHPSGWQPQEKISVAEAIRAYTLAGAYSGFAENRMGRMAPGYVADFVVLSADLFTIDPLLIANTKVSRTIVGGKEVFVAPEAAPRNESARIRVFETSLRPAVSVQGQPEQRWTLQERMEYWKVPGLSIAVIRAGKIAWAKGYGVLQAGGKEPVNDQTIFSVGSVSKVGAAAITLRMVDAGKLDLDRDVNSYLTRWQVPDNSYTAVRPVTLRGVMSHSAGLSVHGFADYQPNEPLPTTVDTLLGRAPAKNSKVEVIYVPGSRFQYSGGGTTVEQLVVEEVSGGDFPSAARKYVFEPLGMSRSTYENPVPAAFGNIAKAHGPDGKPRALPRGYEAMPEKAASGLWTTPSDYAALVIAFIQSYRGTGNFLSGPLARQAMTEVGRSVYGLGPELEGEGLDRRFSHGGANDSYMAWMEGHLATGDGVVIFTNGSAGTQLYTEARRAVALAEGWSDGLDYHQQIPAVTLDAAELSERAGVYAVEDAFVVTNFRHGGDDQEGFEIVQRGGALYRRDQGESLRLYPTDAVHFVAEDGETTYEFLRNYAGRVNALLASRTLDTNTGKITIRASKVERP